MALPNESESVLNSETRARHAAEILKAVAHPLRLRIVAALCKAPSHVNALAGRLGKSQAIVSQQLKILRMHGLVEAERQGGLAVYRLAERQLRNLLRCIEGCEQ